MTNRWVTTFAMGSAAVLIAGAAFAQSTGSGASQPGSGSGTGTPGVTQPAPQPAPSANQPGGSQPSMSTSPGKAQPGMSQPGSGTAAKSAPSDTSPKMGAANGQPGAEKVMNVQKALQEKGVDPGPIDGIMGPKTQSALRSYQKDQKLPETGRMDAKTLEKLGVAS